MPRVKRTTICEPDDKFQPFSEVNLRWIFGRSTEELLNFWPTMNCLKMSVIAKFAVRR
jgi:hypothetical protein